MIAILLVASYVAEKLGIGKSGGTSPPPLQQSAPLSEPPCDYKNYLWLLRLCIDANSDSLGICCKSRHVAQNSAPIGKWMQIRQDGAQIYWYLFDPVDNQTNNINPRKIRYLLNQLLETYCYEETMPFIRVVYVQPQKNGRVAIGVISA